MRHDTAQPKRILAIDPTPRGLGFAVLEGPIHLVDWGVKEVRSNKNERCLGLIEEMIDRYCPDAIVVEEYDGRGSRRCSRVAELIKSASRLATKRKIKVGRISRSEVRDAFSESHAYTKHQIAEAIASRFPELVPRLPRFRKAWMPEDNRMNVFDAVAFALTYFYFEG
jgi:RNase H-fold protein (predicted Holliday junction resolvase)